MEPPDPTWWKPEMHASWFPLLGGMDPSTPRVSLPRLSMLEKCISSYYMLTMGTASGP
jgi:hypothetical protein